MVNMDFMKNEQKLINLLNDLKDNHFTTGVKAEFEDEGSSFEDVLVLKSIADEVGLDFTLKIGGCGALNDLRQAKSLGVSTIVAPMIESSYALKKFVQRVLEVFDNAQLPQLLINIETISGYKNFDEIISVEESRFIDGIVVGRFDMAKSLGGGCKECDSEQLFQIVSDLSLKCQALGKKFLVGGGIKEKTLSFLEKTPYLNFFETRKIVFESQSVIKNQDSHGIIKAIEFEIAWLESKSLQGVQEIKRINALKNRCGNLCTVGSKK